MLERSVQILSTLENSSKIKDYLRIPFNPTYDPVRMSILDMLNTRGNAFNNR